MKTYYLKKIKKIKKKLYNTNTAIQYYNKSKVKININVYNMNSGEEEVYKYGNEEFGN